MGSLSGIYTVDSCIKLVKEHDENDEEIDLETVSIGILEFLCKLLF